MYVCVSACVYVCASVCALVQACVCVCVCASCSAFPLPFAGDQCLHGNNSELAGCLDALQSCSYCPQQHPGPRKHKGAGRNVISNMYKAG